MNEEEELIIYSQNELIAKFMGCEMDENGYYLMGCNLPQFRGSDHPEWCGTKHIDYDFTKPEDVQKCHEVGSYYWEISPNHLCYNGSWEWLMPVWFKIQHMSIIGEIEISDGEIKPYSVFIRGYIWGGDGVGWIMKTFYHDCIEYTPNNRESKDNLEALYKTVVEFIEWYNHNIT